MPLADTVQCTLSTACPCLPTSQAVVTSCRRAGEEGEAAVFRLHEVQLALDEARASLQVRHDAERPQPPHLRIVSCCLLMVYP